MAQWAAAIRIVLILTKTVPLGILLVPTAFKEAFAALGEDIDSILEMVRVDPTYSVYFHDGVKLDLTGDM